MRTIEDYSVNIVMYHYVRPIKKSKYPNIKGLEFDDFKKQMKSWKLKDFQEWFGFTYKEVE